MPRNSPAPFDLVIFDCDGVLVDSEVIACHAVADTLLAFGHAVAADGIAERFTGMSDKDMYAILAAELGGEWPADFDAEMQRRARERFERELQSIPGVEAAVAQLPMARCVASSSVPDNLAYKLRRTGLFALFAPAIFSTALVARGKPAPDIFLYAAAQMSAAPARALVIEDSGPGIAAAKAAGMTAFGFAGGSHCRPSHAERLTAAGADLVFDDMRELPGLIAQRKATLTTS
ncbi:MAG TPA: HAD-IA family hydrolase [Stellaceae bacterium]